MKTKLPATYVSIQIKRDDLEEILDSDDIQELSERPTKHDCSVTTYVAKIDGKHYMFEIEYSYNNGMQLHEDFVKAWLVEPKEVKSIKWVRVLNEK